MDEKSELSKARNAWALTSLRPEEIRREAIREGVGGIVYYGMTPMPPVRPEGDLSHSLQYTSFWGAEEKDNLPGFVLRPQKAINSGKNSIRGKPCTFRERLRPNFILEAWKI